MAEQTTMAEQAAGRRQGLPDGAVERPVRRDFAWPGGKRIGVIISVAFEGWSDGKWPGVSPMGNPLQAGFPDINAVKWAEYAPRCGMPRILRLLARHGVAASVMVCGVMAERYPSLVRDVAAAGHEIVAHSYAMDVIPVYLDEAAERVNIRRTTALLERATGVRPVGWSSPRGTPSVRTERLLAEAGYQWHVDALDDDLPYMLEFGAQKIMTLPASMEVNDLPLHARHGHPARAMLEAFEDALASLRALPDETGRIDAIIHAHVFGRPAGIWVFDRIIEIARGSPDVWVGNWASAVAHARGYFP